MEAADQAPLRLKMKYAETNPAYHYYRRIRDQLKSWREEFRDELDDDCGYKFKTIGQFAKSKTSNVKEQSWIRGMIGSTPCLFTQTASRKVAYLKIPWLGNWKQRRQDKWASPDQPAKLKALAQAVKDKLVAWDAVRSAAPFLIQEMAGFSKLGEQIDELFGGQAFDKNKDMNANIIRFNQYFTLKKSVTEMKQSLLHDWMLVHGINPKDPVQLTQNNVLINQLAQEAPNPADLAAFKMVKMLQLHAENFGRPLPEFKGPKQTVKPEPEKTSVKTPNEKVM